MLSDKNASRLMKDRLCTVLCAWTDGSSVDLQESAPYRDASRSVDVGDEELDVSQ